MNKKWAPYILIIILAAAVLIIKSFKGNDKKEPAPKPKVTNNKKKDPSQEVNRDRGFDRRISFIEYSKHAKCRMECRHISQAEVEEIMRDGKINYNKSDLENARCPRYAIEGDTRDDQHVRIVFAQCNESTTVVTVIDLDNEFKCSCPGDDDKYKNKN